MHRDPAGLSNAEDRKDAETLQADPLVVRHYSMRYLLGPRGVLQRCADNAALVRQPLLFVQGARDEIIDPAGGEEIFRRSAAADKTMMVVPDGGHGWAVVEGRADAIAQWLGARL